MLEKVVMNTFGGLSFFNHPSLIYYSPAERLDANKKKRHKRYAQPQNHPAYVKRRDRMSIDTRYHGIAQSLCCIGQRIEERNYLEPLDRAKRTPGIIRTTGEDQRREDE